MRLINTTLYSYLNTDQIASLNDICSLNESTHRLTIKKEDETDHWLICIEKRPGFFMRIFEYILGIESQRIKDLNEHTYQYFQSYIQKENPDDLTEPIQAIIRVASFLTDHQQSQKLANLITDILKEPIQTRKKEIEENRNALEQSRQELERTTQDIQAQVQEAVLNHQAALQAIKIESKSYVDCLICLKSLTSEQPIYKTRSLDFLKHHSPFFRGYNDFLRDLKNPDPCLNQNLPDNFKTEYPNLKYYFDFQSFNDKAFDTITVIFSRTTSKQKQRLLGAYSLQELTEIYRLSEFLNCSDISNDCLKLIKDQLKNKPQQSLEWAINLTLSGLFDEDANSIKALAFTFVASHFTLLCSTKMENLGHIPFKFIEQILTSSHLKVESRDQLYVFIKQWALDSQLNLQEVLNKKLRRHVY